MDANQYYNSDISGKPKGMIYFLSQKVKRFEKNRRRHASELIQKFSETLLDYGCNDGTFLVNNKDKFNKAIGIDISEKMLEIARKNTEGINVKLIEANSDKGRLPIEDETIDTITCLDVIEHVFDPEHLIEEFARILKPKGVLILTTPNIAWLPHRISLLFGRRPRTSWAKGWDGGHIAYFTFGELSQLLNEKGFKILKKTTGGAFWQLRRIWPSLLGANIVIKAEKLQEINNAEAGI